MKNKYLIRLVFYLDNKDMATTFKEQMYETDEELLIGVLYLNSITDFLFYPIRKLDSWHGTVL